MAIDPFFTTWESPPELRRQGITVRSNIDCAIAIIAMENNLTLYHQDRDFEVIAKSTVLKQKKLDLAIALCMLQKT